LTQISIDSVNKIVKLLKRFSQGQTNLLSDDDRKNIVISHYFTEITRFWNKINYAVRKSMRSIREYSFNDKSFALILYAAYRILWEKATPSDIADETQLAEINLLRRLSTFSWDIALKNKSEEERLSILESIPSFFIQKLKKVMDSETLSDNLRAMNNVQEKNYFTVYLNKDIEFVLNSCFFQTLHSKIAQQGNLFKKDSEIFHIYHIPNKYKSQIISSALNASGDLIILDKGSAIIIDLLAPNPNDLILDMCAAPGVKTSLIFHYTRDQAHIIAADFSLNRVKQMKSFTGRINPHKLNIINADSILGLFRSSIKFDKILLDAPCTGSGTFLSNPELKWRQNEAFLHQNCILQEKLLKSAIGSLKRGGIIVYSTCSLYPEEGEMQIQKVKTLLEPMDLPNWLGKSYKIKNKHIHGTARLFPAQHGTQGFFIGKFKRKQ